MNLCGTGYEFTLINYDVLEVGENFFSSAICMEARKKTFLHGSTKGKKNLS